MLKKSLSSALAAIMVLMPVTGLTGNAAFISLDNTEQYNVMINELSSNKEAPELCDAISENLFADGRGYCSGVWRDRGNSDTSLWCWIEYRHYDKLKLSFNDATITAEEINALLDELGISEEVARAAEPYTDPNTELPTEYLSTLPISSIVILFYDNENVNERCDEIAKTVKERYGDKLEAAKGSFNVVEFYHDNIKWNVFTTINVETLEFVQLTAEQYQTINEDLEEKGYDIQIETEPKKRIVISDAYTESDKLGLMTMLRRDYGIDLYWYRETDVQNSGIEIDFLADGIEGDANLDNKATIADSVAILQHIANRDKYGLKAQGLVNADVDGIEGVTANDALVLQQWDAGIR